MTEKDDTNHDELDEETRELVDEVDETLEQSATPSSESDPWGSSGANTDPDPPSSDKTDDTDSTESAALLAILSLLAKVPLFIVSKLPKKSTIYTKMIVAGYQAMYKNTSAHVIVNTIYGDRDVVPRPAEIDDEENKVRTVNGEEWTLPDGIQTYHIGDSRVMWGVADAHELVSPVGARTAEKVDLDDAVMVRRQRRQKQQQAMAGAGGQQPARADGGVATPSGLNAYSTQFWDGEPFEDVFVNWSNTNPDADGMIVSMEKHYELQHSQAGSEEMKKQEDRGRLAERFESGKKQGLIYVGLVLLGIAVGLFGPSLAGSLGGDGGGGSSVPMMVHALGSLLGVM